MEPNGATELLMLGLAGEGAGSGNDGPGLGDLGVKLSWSAAAMHLAADIWAAQEQARLLGPLSDALGRTAAALQRDLAEFGSAARLEAFARTRLVRQLLGVMRAAPSPPANAGAIDQALDWKSIASERLGILAHSLAGAAVLHAEHLLASRAAAAAGGSEHLGRLLAAARNAASVMNKPPSARTGPAPGPGSWHDIEVKLRKLDTVLSDILLPLRQAPRYPASLEACRNYAEAAAHCGLGAEVAMAYLGEALLAAKPSIPHSDRARRSFRGLQHGLAAMDAALIECRAGVSALQRSLRQKVAERARAVPAGTCLTPFQATALDLAGHAALLGEGMARELIWRAAGLAPDGGVFGVEAQQGAKRFRDDAFAA